MAIDNWLLNQHIKGLQPGCLRFYTWRSPTISLGYHQKQFPAHWTQLEYRGECVELVRRPTGGRAVLHQGDLTYALVTSSLKGSRREVYQHLCQFLIEGWRRLGVELSFGATGRGYIKNPNCFGTATAADLVTVSGYKLIGSAQVYRDGYILQHGSIRLNPDRELFYRAFGEEILEPETSSLDLSSLGIEHVVSALSEAARDCFDIGFEPQVLAPITLQEAIAAYQSPPIN